MDWTLTQWIIAVLIWIGVSIPVGIAFGKFAALQDKQDEE